MAAAVRFRSFVGHTLSLAKWEVFRGRSRMRRRTLVATVLLTLLLLAPLPLETNRGLYTVAVRDNPDALAALREDRRFEIIEGGLERVQGGLADVAVDGVEPVSTRAWRSQSALGAVEQALKNHKLRLLSATGDPNAFPVEIEVRYLERGSEFQSLTTAVPGPGGGEVGEAPRRVPSGPLATPGAGDLVESLTVVSEVTTPSQLRPPLPFGSILLSFLFLFPTYFVAQFYSASVFGDKVQRRGEPLLTSPVGRPALVAGKMLPYLAAGFAFTAAVALGVYGEPGRGLAAAGLFLPVVLFFLASSFFVGLLSRSFKELTFFSIFLATMTSVYLFLPAMFLDVHAISSLSPLSLLARLREGGEILPGDVLFASTPLGVLSLSLFLLGAHLYSGELVFSQQSLSSKLAGISREWGHRLPRLGPFALALVLVPFAYGAQLMLVSLLFSLPPALILAPLLLIAAVVEEAVKLLAVAPRLGEPRGRALRGALLAGAGFWVGEKVLLLGALSTFSGSLLAEALYQSRLLLVPLGAHMLYTTLALFGVRLLGRRMLWPTLLGVGGLHAGVNYLIAGGLLR